MSEPEVRIGEMRGTARLVIKAAQPKPVLRLVKDDDSEKARPIDREKDNEHGR